MASKKFRDLNVNFRDVMGLSVSQRLDMLRSNEGQSILANFTPAQLADMFPRYYSEKLPSVGKSLSRVSGGTVGEAPTATTQRETVQPVQQRRGGTSGIPTSLPDTGNPRARRNAPESQQPSWLKKLEPFAPGISDPGAKAQLSREHKDVLEQLKKGTIAVDDPRVAFLKDVSAADLKKSGIERGDQGYKASAIQVSREEVETARKSTISGNSNQEIVMKAFASELKKKGVPQENIPYAVASLAGQVKQESGFNPRLPHDKNTGYGIYGARDPKPGQGRKTDMFKWLDQNGYSRDSAEGQARYMVHEAFGGKFPKSREALMSANKDNIGQVTGVLVNEFEKPQEREGNIRVRTQHANGLINSALRIGQNVDVSSNMSDEQIEQTIRKKKEQERESTIAGSLVPKLPQGVDPKFAEQYERLSPGQKQKVHEAIKKMGEGNTDAGAQKFNELYRSNPAKVERDARASTGWVSPVASEYQINSNYGMRTDPVTGSFTRPHTGVDYKTGANADVRAVKPGEVIFAGAAGGYGNTIQIRHSDGTISQYSHLNKMNVKIGEKIEQGGRNIGLTGATGRVTGPHLHFEMRRDNGQQSRSGLYGTPVDPTPYIQQKPPTEGNPVQTPEAARALPARGLQAYGALALKPKTEGTQTPQVTQPAVPAQPQQQQTQQAPQQRPVGGSTGALAPLPNVSMQPPASQPQQRAPSQEQTSTRTTEQIKVGGVVVSENGQRTTLSDEEQHKVKQAETLKQMMGNQQAFALGGETEAQGPLTAYSIDKDRMRRDDTIVTDGRVKFTMNSEKESMKYNPDTGKVQIDQARGEARQKMNASELQPVEKQQEQQQEPQQEQQVMQNQATQVQPVPQQLPNSYDTTLDLTSDIFKTSSFKRAVAQSRFMKDNDPLGGHHDFGAYNIT